MRKSDYFTSDMADEILERKGIRNCPGISFSKEQRNKINISSVKVENTAGEFIIQKPIGNYITIFFDNLSFSEQTDLDSIVNVLSEKIKDVALPYISSLRSPSVLVVGLGNRYVTADSLGPLAADNISVSKREKGFSISAISPGVMAQTGVETFELVKGAIDRIKPDLVIVLDALASGSVDRLASTLQISDTGISPGSALGKTAAGLTKQTLGIPVIAVGAPTMVSSATLVYDALGKAGVNSVSRKLKAVLENGKSFFVTPNNCDRIVKLLSKLISDAVNISFAE